jgi:hypothetical protein
MMRNAPFVSTPDDQHAEARRRWYRFAVCHSRNSVIADGDYAPFVDRILVARTLGGCELGDDR